MPWKNKFLQTILIVNMYYLSSKPGYHNAVTLCLQRMAVAKLVTIINLVQCKSTTLSNDGIYHDQTQMLSPRVGI